MSYSILILGGTGFVGRSLCAALLNHSAHLVKRIVVPSRRPNRANFLKTLPTLELPKANIHDDATLRNLVRQVDIVVNLAAILHGNAQQFELVHVTLPMRLAQICQSQGVKRMIHISALGVQTLPEQAPSLYLRSKSAGEAALHISKWLNLSILRPSVIFGEHDRFVNLFAQLQGLFPVMPLAYSKSLFQPVWVEDVARAIVHCIEHPQWIGQTIECVGPSTMSLADIVRKAGQWSGHARPIVPLPAWLGYIQAAALECLPTPLMSRDNLASMQVPNIATHEHPDLRALGIIPCSMESVMPAVLGSVPKNVRARSGAFNP